MSQPEEITWAPNTPRPAEMTAMFEEARAKGLWFFCHYQWLWWTPDELEDQQRRGNFRWGPKNFKLRHPVELERQLIKDLSDKQEDLQKFYALLARFHESQEKHKALVQSSALAKARGES